jgi:hypothetical protein
MKRRREEKRLKPSKRHKRQTDDAGLRITSHWYKDTTYLCGHFKLATKWGQNPRMFVCGIYSNFQQPRMMNRQGQIVKSGFLDTGVIKLRFENFQRSIFQLAPSIAEEDFSFCWFAPSKNVLPYCQSGSERRKAIDDVLQYTNASADVIQNIIWSYESEVTLWFTLIVFKHPPYRVRYVYYAEDYDTALKHYKQAQNRQAKEDTYALSCRYQMSCDEWCD